ncbi:MAG: arginine repressor [Clostridia bacterium]|nr:arginine repressor [Clostridia bacterium]
MKKERLTRIKELVLEFDITTQDMLVDILNKDGYNVTQATVSRDIKKLGLIKSFEDGVNKYVLKKETETGEHSLILKNSVLSVRTAQNLVIIRCAAGMANAVCVYIDSLELHGLVGTLAGDDTIFIAALDNVSAENIREILVTRIK